MIDTLLAPAKCRALLAALPSIEGSGTRNLLELPPFMALVEVLRGHVDLRHLVTNLIAVQGILFRKCVAKNWSVRLHRDQVIPVEGQGPWPSAGKKECASYVRAPFDFLSQCLIVRISLNDVPEGDIQVVPGSHSHPGSRPHAAKTILRVPRGGALAMRPTLLHGSSKLSQSKARNVVHYLFEPDALPPHYFWLHGRPAVGDH